MRYIEECCVKSFNDRLDELCSYISMDSELPYVIPEHQQCFEIYINELKKSSNAVSMLDLIINNLSRESLPMTISITSLSFSSLAIILSFLEEEKVYSWLSIIIVVLVAISISLAIYLNFKHMGKIEKQKKCKFIQSVLKGEI